MNTLLLSYRRAMLGLRVRTKHEEGGRVTYKRLGNAQIWRLAGILPVEKELVVRRLKWAQS
eukprot:14297004-Alexandrium_andersonii.AAC.1